MGVLGANPLQELTDFPPPTTWMMGEMENVADVQTN